MGITIITLVISAVITIVVLLFVFKMVSGSMGDKKTLQNGVPGTATVMSISPTGTDCLIITS